MPQGVEHKRKQCKADGLDSCEDSIDAARR